MDFNLKDHTILLSLTGSRAYGTNIETSDYDYKGIAVPPLSYYFGYSKNFEQSEELVSKGHDADRTVYAIRKFFKLAAEGNPNILEILFSPEDCRVITTYWSDLLVENRDLFLSKRLRYSYSGYAHSQLKRLKNHREWLLHPPSHAPTREEFGLPPEKDKRIGKSNVNLVPALEEMGYSFSAEAISSLQREKEYLNAMDVWKKYSNWKKNRNKDRAALEAKYGFDGKHGMHLLRLMRTAVEIFSGEGLQVRRKDAKELLSIRQGEWSLDRLLEEADELEDKLTHLYEKSTLPKCPPVNKLDSLCQEITEGFLVVEGFLQGPE